MKAQRNRETLESMLRFLLQNTDAEQRTLRKTLFACMHIFRQELDQPHLTSNNKWTTKQSIPQEQCLIEAILFNQTLPRSHKRRKNPTVTPAHALKTLFRQVIPNKIPDYTLQTLSRFMQKRINPYVLFAQTAFGLIGGFFFIIGLLGTFSWRPGLNSGPSPIIGVFIGLPLIAVAVLLTNLHKKAFGAEDQKILLKCLSCGHLNVEETKYCGNCGKPLFAEGRHPASDR